MNKPGSISVTALLERVEYEIETANGRTARVCRDERGDIWVVDDAERVVSLYDFADECHHAARELCAIGRGESFRRITASMKEGFARVAKAFQRPVPKTAQA